MDPSSLLDFIRVFSFIGILFRSIITTYPIHSSVAAHGAAEAIARDLMRPSAAPTPLRRARGRPPIHGRVAIRTAPACDRSAIGSPDAGDLRP